MALNRGVYLLYRGVMVQPSLRQLDIFAQMVATGSFTRCADELGLSRQDVEQDMASLELRLGYRLFETQGEEARLTPAGRKTAQALTLLSQSASDSWDDAPPVSETPAPATRQTIILAAPAPVFGHFQDALAAFEAANEDVAITLDLGVHLASDARAGFARRTIDIAYFYALTEPPGLASRYGWSEQLNLYVGDDHPFASMASVSREDIAASAMVAMEPRSGLRRISDEALALAGMAARMPAMETDAMFDIIAALRSGTGYFPAFGPLARDLGRMSGIRRIPLEMPLPAIEVRQAIRPGAEDDMAVGALAEFLFL